MPLSYRQYYKKDILYLSIFFKCGRKLCHAMQWLAKCYKKSPSYIFLGYSVWWHSLNSWQEKVQTRIKKKYKKKVTDKEESEKKQISLKKKKKA